MPKLPKMANRESTEMPEAEFIWGPDGSCLVLAFTPQRCGSCHVMRSLFVNDKRTTLFGGTVCCGCWGELPEVMEKTA